MSEDFGGWGMPLSIYGFILLIALVTAAVIVFVSDRMIDAWRWAKLKWKAHRLRRSARCYEARARTAHEGHVHGTIYKSKGKRAR